MHADAFRHIYSYHMLINHRIWDECIMTLSDAQFTQELDYSLGSVRNQVVHMMSVDERWFAGLRGVELPDFLNPEHYTDRMKVRAEWDRVEADMRTWLDALDDVTLATEFDAGLKVWQVLFHVVNHGTDHRAQLLAGLHRLGAATFAQDYAYFALGRM